MSNDEEEDRDDEIQADGKDDERGDDSEDYSVSSAGNKRQLPPGLADDYVPPVGEPNLYDKKYVVRCTLGGCYKYYHVTCVY